VHATAEDALSSDLLHAAKARVDLIFTSPPFPLNRKKRYGNVQGEEYIEWLSAFAVEFKKFLKPTGSIVIEVGNSWEPGRPVMSTLALRSLLRFLDRGDLRLCQQFVYHNPARLPGPAQWVNVERIRVKDSYTHLWWMAATDRPYADNREVLQDYSAAMKKLLRDRKYNAGRRPSEHRIGQESFFTNNAGAIPSNVVAVEDDEIAATNVLRMSNTDSLSPYLKYCRENGLTPHPARMPIGLPQFFIKFLTKPGGLVLDPFGGSMTTGAAAEALGRSWIAVEPSEEYIAGSRGRFLAPFDATGT
jgi:site-specific DNA-methyltransferase (cytosine-N4-specific)